MSNANTEKHQVMTVVLPEMKATFDENGVIVNPAVLVPLSRKAAALSKYVRRHFRGSAITAEIRINQPDVISIDIFAAPVSARHERDQDAFPTDMRNFSVAFAADRAALAALAAGEAPEDADGVVAPKAIAARAVLRKVVEDKRDAELRFLVGDEPPIGVQTSKPTSSTRLAKEEEEITGSVRDVDSQDNRVRLFKIGPRRPNLTLYVPNADDRLRLMDAQRAEAEVTIKFRRLTNSMTSSRAPRHGVLVKIEEIGGT